MIVKLTPSLQLFFVFPFFLLLAAGLMIPSDGSHGMFNIKSLAFIMTLITCCSYVIICRKLNILQLKTLLFFGTALAFLSFWIVISLLESETPAESTIDQLKLFIITLSIIVISIYFEAEGLITFQQILKTVLLTNFTYSLIKVTLVTLHLLGLINMWAIIDMTGIRFMSMEIFAGLPRVQTSMDVVTPYLLFFFLQSKSFGIHWSKKFQAAFLAVSTFAIFLSFSRYLIAIGLLSLGLHIFTLKLKSIVIAIGVFLFVATTATYIIGPDIVYKIIERRFLSRDSYVSDKTRVEQIDALLDEYSESPWFGKGIGGYAKSFIRDNRLVHSYEVQWLAFLMQFGTMGILGFLLAIGVLSSLILAPPLSRFKIGLFVLFLSWLASGFTNPFLISLTSGIVYTLFLFSARNYPSALHGD